MAARGPAIPRAPKWGAAKCGAAPTRGAEKRGAAGPPKRAPAAGAAKRGAAGAATWGAAGAPPWNPRPCAWTEATDAGTAKIRTAIMPTRRAHVLTANPSRPYKHEQRLWFQRRADLPGQNRGRRTIRSEPAGGQSAGLLRPAAHAPVWLRGLSAAGKQVPSAPTGSKDSGMTDSGSREKSVHQTTNHEQRARRSIEALFSSMLTNKGKFRLGPQPCVSTSLFLFSKNHLTLDERPPRARLPPQHHSWTSTAK